MQNVCQKKREWKCAKSDKKKVHVSRVQFSQAMAAEATEIETRNTLTKMFEKFTRINPLLKFT